MNLHVLFHELAENELNDTIDYYNSYSKGLGSVFLTEVERAVHQILEFPESSPLVNRFVRKKIIHRFPYNVMYSIIPEGIWVLAIANQKRRTHYWRNRMTMD